MTTAVSALEMPKMRKFTYQVGDKEVAYGLSKGVITENGNPKVNVLRWDVDPHFRQIEKTLEVPEREVNPQTLYESHHAAQHNPEIGIFKWPAEWQSHLILNPNAPTDTTKNPREGEDKYVLKDVDGKTLTSSSQERLLNPTQIQKDGEIYVVTANVFDIPFKLDDGRYEPEDLNPETGFLARPPRSSGKYGIWFDENERLYAVSLDWSGAANCSWEPSFSDDNVGFRGRSTGNQGSLFETKEDILQAKLETIEKDRTDKREQMLSELERLEAHYDSGLKDLRALKENLQDL